MDAHTTPILDGIKSLAGRYDGWIVDLWGTVHDGYRPLPGVVDALQRLRADGRRVVILSNAPRRNAAVVSRMTEIGIESGLYDHVLSSGEAANRALAERSDRWHAALGRRYYHLGPLRDDSIFEDLDLEPVDRLSDAEFIVNTGLDQPDETVSDYEPLLVQGADLGLPMVCANPDLIVLRGDERELCAGALAARYETLGGAVYYHGKPHPAIYDKCFALLDIEDRSRVVAIGDSMKTDIAGARAVGIECLLVTGGIHAEALGIRAGETPRPDRLARLYDEFGLTPTAAVAAFRWL